MSPAPDDSISMETLVSSLSVNLRHVPPLAVPPMLDCLLASTGASPSALFDSLLSSFPQLAGGVSNVGDGCDSAECIWSLVHALCHLLKKPGACKDALQSFIWRFFIPLMKMTHVFGRELLNQTTEALFDVLTHTNSWRTIETNLIPFLLKSIGMTSGMLRNSDLEVFVWSSSPESPGDMMNGALVENKRVISSSGSVVLPIACHVLSQILDVIQSNQSAPATEDLLSNGYNVGNIAIDLLWDLSIVSERLLLQSSEHRSCTINLLLPTIFKAYLVNSCLEVSIHGQTYTLSRRLFTKKIWMCCKRLFSHGHLERRDAYCALSLCLSFCNFPEEYANSSMTLLADEFDIRHDKEFWDEIKRGLVDKEGLVRKQSLHILKMVLHINQENQNLSGFSDTTLEDDSNTPAMTKRESWAHKEAKSLGVGNVCKSFESQQSWGAFILLYETLEEYGTHLVEAAWNHQIFSLLRYCDSDDNFLRYMDTRETTQETLSDEFSNWVSILWERGFHHDNPLGIVSLIRQLVARVSDHSAVRCLILESFLGIEWENYGRCVKALPESFVLGPLIQGLNDPVHHQEFGIRGVYSSKAIEGATRFFDQYTCHLNPREQIAFLTSLASVAKQQSFSRSGLMALSGCISSVACRIGSEDNEAEHARICSPHGINNLVDALRFVVESCKHHFNPNYRRQVCEKLLKAAMAVVCSFSLPLEILLCFISSFPREFTTHGGPLRVKFHEWLMGCRKNQHANNCCSMNMKLLNSLHDFPQRFINFSPTVGASFTCDDEEMAAWEFEAKRWAMVLFLVSEEDHCLEPVLKFIETHRGLLNQSSNVEGIPMKYLILILSLVMELQEMQERATICNTRKSKFGTVDIVAVNHVEASSIYEKFLRVSVSILEVLVSDDKTCSIFWSSSVMKGEPLPGSVKGKLGGPSQRRLSSSVTTAVLQAIISVKAVAYLGLWCRQMGSNAPTDSAFKFLWDFLWRTISSSTCDSEVEAEVVLAAYEALAPALRTIALAFSLLASDRMWQRQTEGKPLFDSLMSTFLQNINDLLTVKFLVRSRRAFLMNIKWHCLESLLSIPFHALKNGIQLKGDKLFFSDVAVRLIFEDIVESLENAGEDSVLPILRSLRLVLELFASGRLQSVVSSSVYMESEMMWQLVRSSWVLHASCNKRRVAAISALLSSVLHPSVFSEERMHVIGDSDGPLKWFVEKVLEEGTKSPRTIRLAALHLTGLWLSNPRILKCYIKEVKLLSLYGSVAFDEDFEAELADNHDANIEVSLLAKVPEYEPGLTEVFINTELFARVSVSVLFNKLADMAEKVGSTSETEVCVSALEAGKHFLLQLLDAAVNDKDLAKELYKKYSAIHRRKIRAWQMICVLTRFITPDIVEQVTQSLHTALSRNNLPAVRQYLETFAINVYLRFPSLVSQQLVPILQDYDVRPQALSSYVFIAANIILHASGDVRTRHLDELLPPILPLLTSHHHSLRGFTQLLVYKVLCRFFDSDVPGVPESMPLEKRCFVNLREYLAKNSDCTRLRASMEGYLDAYDPQVSATPSGIFVNRVEELEFECVPTSLMEQVLNFLNDVREDLRSSMAKDLVTIKNESLKINDDHSSLHHASSQNTQISETLSMDFQKKFTLSKHEKQDNGVSSFNLNETFKQLLEMEKEDQLVDQLLQSRLVTIDRIRASRQEIIVVASLIDRIPNLAGLARTCEVFKASGLVVADSSIVHDKQFKLISVTAEKWVPMMEVPVQSLKGFLEKKKREGYSVLGLEQTANSVPLDVFTFPKKTVLVLGREKEGIPVEIIHILDSCIEIPQLGVVRSLNVHVSGAIALWEYTRQQRSQ